MACFALDFMGSENCKNPIASEFFARIEIEPGCLAASAKAFLISSATEILFSFNKTSFPNRMF